MYSSVLLFTAYSPAKFTLSILYCSYFLGITFMKDLFNTLEDPK